MSDILEAGRRAGHACWIEQRLFETLGSWVADAARSAEPALSRMLAEHAHHHAWHAELWRDRLPELAEHPPADAVRPRHEAAVELVDTLSSVDGTVERLVGVYRVLLPRLADEYDAQLQATSPLTDGPTARVLKLCLADLHDDRSEGEATLRSLIDSPEVAATAHAREVALETLAAAANGLTS